MLIEFTVPVPPGRTLTPGAVRALTGQQVKVSANGVEVAWGTVTEVSDDARPGALVVTVDLPASAAAPVQVIREVPGAFEVKICQCPRQCPPRCQPWPPAPAAAGDAGEPSGAGAPDHP